MNAKKVKAIRAFIRGKGINPREDRYTEDAKTRRIRVIPTGGLTAEGKPEVRHQQVVSYVLAADCGRAVYHGLKRAAA